MSVEYKHNDHETPENPRYTTRVSNTYEEIRESTAYEEIADDSAGKDPRYEDTVQHKASSDDDGKTKDPAYDYAAGQDVVNERLDLESSTPTDIVIASDDYAISYTENDLYHWLKIGV